MYIRCDLIKDSVHDSIPNHEIEIECDFLCSVESFSMVYYTSWWWVNWLGMCIILCCGVLCVFGTAITYHSTEAMKQLLSRRFSFHENLISRFIKRPKMPNEKKMHNKTFHSIRRFIESYVPNAIIDSDKRATRERPFAWLSKWEKNGGYHQNPTKKNKEQSPDFLFL